MTNQNQLKPDPAQIAQQLRKPSGPLAKSIAEKKERTMSEQKNIQLQEKTMKEVKRWQM